MNARAAHLQDARARQRSQGFVCGILGAVLIQLVAPDRARAGKAVTLIGRKPACRHQPGALVGLLSRIAPLERHLVVYGHLGVRFRVLR